MTRGSPWPPVAPGGPPPPGAPATTHPATTHPARSFGGGPPTHSGPDRLAYLREVCAILWPSPATVTLSAATPGAATPASLGAPGPGAAGAARGTAGEFILVPGAYRPRLLVPTARRAAAVALRNYGEPGSRVTRIGTRALSLALASGLGGIALRSRLRVHAPRGADTIASYLSGVLGCDVRIGMHLGAARANRKPVLQLLSAGGEPLGFAKIAVNSLTRDLVRAERDTLTRLQRTRLRLLEPPRVLHHGVWRGHDVLVLSPLPVWLRRRPLPAPALAAAMTEVAQAGGLRREPLAASGYLRRLAGRLAAAGDGPERTALRRALETLAARAGDTVLTWGAWHGDWTPWNMASTRRGLLVWDWERFTAGVPVGYDALHCHLQAAVVARRREPLAAATGCVADAARLLAPFGVDGGQARLTAVLYLADLAARYLADRQEQAGARLGAPGTWLIPAIDGEVGRL